MSNNEIIRQIVSEVISKDLGGVTAYAAAVNRGYTGTKEQFETLMASYATVAQQAVDAKEAAETAQGLAEDARDDAVAAKEAAQTANTGAVTAKNAAETAQGKAETAQGKAEDAQEAAESAKDDAVAAKNSVESTASNFASTAAQAVSEVNAAGTNQKNLAQAQAENAQAYAEGKRGSSTVGQSDPAYHNNAKYYSEQAAGGASGAGASALVAEGYAKGTQSGTAVTSDSPYYQDNAAYHKEQAAANASDAEAWANGTRGGEDIESDDPAYGKSAKDYAEEAAASAASLTVDSALSDSSTNPVQNKVVNAAVNSLMEDLTHVINMEDIDDQTHLTFEYGQIHGSSYGNHTASTTTCFNLTKIKSSLFDTLTFNNAVYKIAFVGYSEAGVYQNVGAWLTTSPIILSTVNVTGDFWCVQVRRQDGASLSDSDLANINAVLHDITENKIITSIGMLETAVYNVGYVDGTNGNDANEGTDSAPYKTIMKAVNAKKQVINVKAGTYPEMVNLQNITYPVSIRLWEMPTYDGAVEEAPKIIIDGGENRSFYYGIVCNNNGSIELSDIHCKRTSETPFYIKRVKSIKCVRCIASDSAPNKSGFTIENVNGEFIDCMAYNIAVDGFNIHGYGNTEFINCVAHDCGDDGISHHDGCTGHISGGEYCNCSKGGVSSPTYGAYIDIDGVYSHDNTYGMYSVSEDASRRNTKSRVSNCVFKDNTSSDLRLTNTVVTMWNTKYDTKSIAETATLNEIT